MAGVTLDVLADDGVERAQRLLQPGFWRGIGTHDIFRNP